MIENPSQIKHLRKNLGITQKELAKLSGVSQSLIAKIESEKIDPSYSKVYKIINVLEQCKSRKSEKAFSIMTKRVFSASPNNRIKDVVLVMKQRKISQMPVISKGKCIGLISESSIIKVLSEGKKVEFVKEIMEEAPPIVSINTDLNVISELLKHFPLVLVQDSKHYAGVITKTDLLNKFYK
ncbi:MAG: CBS domain-containing protein [Candidatus Woesearchaeota archaeon]